MAKTGPRLEKGGHGDYGGHFIKLFPPSDLFRAILVRRDEIRLLSSEFTPETERQRIQQLVVSLARGLLTPGRRPYRALGGSLI